MHQMIQRHLDSLGCQLASSIAETQFCREQMGVLGDNPPVLASLLKEQERHLSRAQTLHDQIEQIKSAENQSV